PDPDALAPRHVDDDIGEQDDEPRPERPEAVGKRPAPAVPAANGPDDEPDRHSRERAQARVADQVIGRYADVGRVAPVQRPDSEERSTDDPDAEQHGDPGPPAIGAS